jgi:hypothetical protein
VKLSLRPALDDVLRCASGGQQDALRDGDQNPDFSEVLVLAHVRLRRYRFIECEAPVDRQLTAHEVWGST